MYYIMGVSDVQHSNTINFLLLLVMRTFKIHSPSNFQICHAAFLFHRFYPHLNTTSDGMAENKVRLLKICCCNRVSLGWEPGDLDFWLYLAMDELCDLGQMSLLLWVFFRNKDGVRPIKFSNATICPSALEVHPPTIEIM